MNAQRIFTLIMILTTMVAGFAEAGGRCGNGKGKGQGAGKNKGSCESSLTSLPLEHLSDYEKESLLLMRQEEKLARDVYLTLGEEFDNQVFANIPRSEQRHMDRMGELLERYGLEDPLVDGARGEFSSSEMQSLYDGLVEKGMKSELDALRVGATIEDLDIHDLETALAEGVDNQDIAMVYRNLAKGSRNHMRAFTTQLKNQGVDYQAQYISQGDLAAIVDSNWERGPADGQGRGGKGKGMGQGQGKGQGRCQD